MPAIISDTSILLQPDNIGYQAFRIPLAAAPAGAVTMVFYYKAYVDGVGQNVHEDGGSYGWNNDAFFGLSFSGNVAANTGGIVGWSNTTGNTILRTQGRTTGTIYAHFANSGLNATPLYFGDDNRFFAYGSQIGTGVLPTNGGFCFPTTDPIGAEEAGKFLGIVKISRQDNNTQNIVLSYGVNWENRALADFPGALSAAATNWIFSNQALAETVNFRPGGAMNFPGWIVGKWPSGVIGRTLTITALRVEYYNGVL